VVIASWKTEEEFVEIVQWLFGLASLVCVDLVEYFLSFIAVKDRKLSQYCYLTNHETIKTQAFRTSLLEHPTSLVRGLTLSSMDFPLQQSTKGKRGVQLNVLLMTVRPEQVQSLPFSVFLPRRKKDLKDTCLLML
jgi:hypothetical protein